MNLRHLRNVVALADTANFARAAAAVHLSQPAFSRSIQAIEEELGVLLFDRSERRPYLTAYGKLVVERARKMLAEEKELRRDMNLMKNNEFGEVNFGVGPFPAGSLLVDMIAQTARLYPNLCLRVDVSHWQNLVELLQAERFDFIIADTRDIQNVSFLSITPLPRLRVRCFCRPGHPLLEQKSVSIEDLLEFPLASVKHPQTAMTQLSHQFGEGRDPTKLFALECDNLLVVEEVAHQSDMILVAPSSERSLLVELKVREFRQQTHYGIITLRNRTQSAAVAAVIKIAQQVVAELEKREAVDSQVEGPRAPARPRKR